MTIHYHGSPITPREVLHKLAGRCFCVSFARPEDIRICDSIGQALMLDNGAFSAWRRGYQVDWQAYYAWTDRWLGRPTTWAVIPDVIDAGPQAQDQLLAQWPHGKQRGAPVWHLNEPINRLLRLLESWPRVCFGSSGIFAVVGTDTWHARVTAAWNAIGRRHHRTPNIHMLRGMQTVRWTYPFASVDSTDLARNHKRGGDIVARARLWDARQCPAVWAECGEQLELVA